MENGSLTGARAALLAVIQAHIQQEKQVIWAAVWRDFHRISEDVGRALAPLAAALQIARKAAVPLGRADVRACVGFSQRLHP